MASTDLVVITIQLIVKSFGLYTILTNCPSSFDLGKANMISTTIWPSACSMPERRLYGLFADGRYVCLVGLRVADELPLVGQHLMDGVLNELVDVLCGHLRLL